MVSIKTNKDVKKNNVSAVLRCIYINTKISRIDLSKKLDLSPSTVSLIVEKLISQNKVFEETIGTSTGGRKPVHLTIDHDYYCCLVVKIRFEEIEIVLLNTRLEVFDKVSKKNNGVSFGEIYEYIKNAIEFLLRKHSKKSCFAIGMTLDSCYSVMDKNVAIELQYEIISMSIVDALKFTFHIPAAQYNNITTKALSHHKQISSLTNSKVFYLDIGENIEAVVVSNQASGINYKKLDNFGEVLTFFETPNNFQNKKLKDLASIRGIFKVLFGNGKGITTQKKLELLQGSEHLNLHLKKAIQALILNVHNYAIMNDVKKVVIGGELEKITAFQEIFNKTVPKELSGIKYFTTEILGLDKDKGVGAMLVDEFFLKEK